jgi:tetratricopeptide (TPR) repeat protein
VTGHVVRAQVLMSQNRYKLARDELRVALSESADNGLVHALLAFCLLEQKDIAAAAEEAQQAVGLSPDEPYPYFVLARVRLEQKRPADAEQAMQAAIRLAPEDAQFHGLLGAIYLEQERWTEALAAADGGLQCDPENDFCTNVRVAALTKLGRRAEADASVKSALSRDPENEFTHYSQGYVCLHAGQHAAALEHFREALRLNPESEGAREGLILSLKARYRLYRVLLAYFLWMGRLPRNVRIGLIVGAYVAVRLIREVGRGYPELKPYTLAIGLVYVIFVFLTWTADPLFNLLLRLNRFGRAALSRSQTMAANCVAFTLLIALASGVAGLFSASTPLILFGVGAAIMILPISGTFTAAGRARLLLAFYTVGLIAAGVGALAAALAGASVASTLGVVFLLGWVGFSWVATGLAVGRVR